METFLPLYRLKSAELQAGRRFEISNHPVRVGVVSLAADRRRPSALYAKSARKGDGLSTSQQVSRSIGQQVSRSAGQQVSQSEGQCDYLDACHYYGHSQIAALNHYFPDECVFRSLQDARSFLEEEKILEEVETAAVKRVIAWQLDNAMKEQRLSKRAMAHRLYTSRSQVERLRDPGNTAVSLQTVAQAATALGKSLKMEL